MIRRTLKSGLLAAVAVLALLPSAAGASAASATAQHPVPGVATYDTHHHRAHHRGINRQPVHHRTHLRRHHARRVYRIHRGHGSTIQGMAYRFDPRSTTYRLTRHAAPYRLPYRLAAQPMSYRRTWSAVGRVATRHVRLNVRSGPGTGYRVIGHRASGRHLALVCRTRGSSVYGNRTWYRLPHHAGYVSAHYVRADRVLPWC